MDRRLFTRAGLGIFPMAFPTSANAATGKNHRVAIQINSEDRHSQAGALGNAHNYAAYYSAKGEPFAIEIVTLGPGYSMVRADMSMMKGELETLQRELGGDLHIVACQNTRRALADNEGKNQKTSRCFPGSVKRRVAWSGSPSSRNKVGSTSGLDPAGIVPLAIAFVWLCRHLWDADQGDHREMKCANGVMWSDPSAKSLL